MTTPAKILQILRQTQPAELDILALAHENTKPDGTIDYQAMASGRYRLASAEEELTAHIKGIKRAHANLLKASGIRQ